MPVGSFSAAPFVVKGVAMDSVHKTNALRILDSLHISYEVAAHAVGTEHMDANAMAEIEPVRLTLQVQPDHENPHM